MKTITKALLLSVFVFLSIMFIIFSSGKTYSIIDRAIEERNMDVCNEIPSWKLHFYIDPGGEGVPSLPEIETYRRRCWYDFKNFIMENLAMPEEAWMKIVQERNPELCLALGDDVDVLCLDRYKSQVNPSICHLYYGISYDSESPIYQETPINRVIQCRADLVTYGLENSSVCEEYTGTDRSECYLDIMKQYLNSRSAAAYLPPKTIIDKAGNELQINLITVKPSIPAGFCEDLEPKARHLSKKIVYESCKRTEESFRRSN